MVSSSSETWRQTVLDGELDAFLIDRESRRTSPNTMTWYRYVLAPFREFMHAQGIEKTESITPGILRRYIVHRSSERDYNDGGVANVFSATKSFLNWYEAECNPEETCSNPGQPTELIVA